MPVWGNWPNTLLKLSKTTDLACFPFRASVFLRLKCLLLSVYVVYKLSFVYIVSFLVFAGASSVRGCVRACVRACMRACVRVCVCVCVCV